MRKSLYIFKSGKLYRKENTIYFENEKEKKSSPVNAVLDIHIFGEVDLNKRFLEFATKNKICIHFYNSSKYYIGSFYPREFYNSGFIILEQVKHYLELEKRLFLAKSFVLGSVLNIMKNLGAYNLKDKEEEINGILKNLENANSIDEVRAIEGNVKKIYYQAFNDIIKNEDFRMHQRTKRPPENSINALISFGNSLIYTTTLSQIYRTYLDPRIGYLHETNYRRFSLNLDISEIFKPVIVDRVIFSVLNKGQIQSKHFSSELEGIYLNEEGMKIFIKAFEDKLSNKIKYKNLGSVSYRRLIRIECYKLYKHFIGEEIYKPFVMKE